MPGRALLLILPVLLLAGCETMGGGSSSRKGAAAAPRAGAASQQRAYDRGVAFFAEEKYEEARRAWAEAVRLGPSTATGRKAQENLTKVETMLKNLRAIEAAK